MSGKRVCLGNGVGIDIETAADAVTTEGTADRGKSPERCGQTDRQLIGLMKSIIR